MSGVAEAAEQDVLPQTAIVAEVLPVQAALVIRELQVLRFTLHSSVESDERRRHVHEVGPITSLSILRSLRERKTYHSWTCSERWEIAPSGV